MPDPRYPLYVVSKGRAAPRLTVRALEDMGAEYHVVIEQSDYGGYAAVIDPARLLILDPAYQREYETCDEHGQDKPVGPGAARNFVWDHAQAAGYDRHWVMDDNIRAFYRFHHGKRLYARTPTVFWAMEEFVGRYENVGMAGPNYVMFAPETQRLPPFVMNTRIYSCNLIRNDLPYRWRGRYNEDTDLSLRMLKDGLATVQFNAFLQQKMWTREPTGDRARAGSGGNTDAFYNREGTLPKSRMIVRLHPDVATLTWRFGRWHHYVDYRSFRGNRLRFRPGIEIPDGPNEFGMRLVQERDTIRSPRIQQILAAEQGRVANQPY